LIFSPQKTPARHIALLGTLLLLSITALAFSRRIQQQSQPQIQPQPAPPPYKNSFPVTHATTPATDTAPATATPAPKPQLPVRTSAERLHNALVSLPPLPFHSTTIVIDPAHGGADNGSRISDNIVEKDVTLALAFRLRSLLTARGFNVVLTREDDKATNASPPFAPLSLDDRAGIANHERASACIFLHATSSGTGVHLYTSELTPAPGELPAAPWLILQAPWVTQSHHLAGRIADALNRSRIPLVDGYASIRPVDSTACPALVFELAPRTDDPDSINDADYQQSIAQATANALILWKNAAQPPPHLSPPVPEPTTAEATTP
jgi:N-acetylmuramoyl-L-alanine amidase